jgi:hypothetical protein
MTIFLHLWWYLAEFFLEWEIFEMKVLEKTKTDVLCSISFSNKSCRFWDNVENYIGIRETTEKNILRMRFADWIPKAKNTLRIYNTLCFSTAKTFTRKSLSIMLYVFCLSCVLCNRDILWMESIGVSNRIELNSKLLEFVFTYWLLISITT